MSVKIRMMRMGRRHRPFFRINAIDSRAPRNGKIIEKLGYYDPIEKDPAKQIVLKVDRVKYWLEKGAIPSDSISELLKRQGIKNEHVVKVRARRKRARQALRKKGQPFTKAEKIAAGHFKTETKGEAEPAPTT